MRLTRFTDNALRCLLLLGLEPERCITVNEVAERMNMSYEHLVKIVHRLSEFGYVETVRGRRGGVRLGKAAGDIVLGALVRQTEDNLALVECFDPEHSTCPILSACRLAGTLDEALKAFLAVLDRQTLADLLEPRERLVLLVAGREPSGGGTEGGNGSGPRTANGTRNGTTGRGKVATTPTSGFA
jgi:Rrf2 family nitric oxide-sensitive transcriptional repressor